MEWRSSVKVCNYGNLNSSLLLSLWFLRKNMLIGGKYLSTLCFAS